MEHVIVKRKICFFFLNRLSLNFDQYSILSLQRWRVKKYGQGTVCDNWLIEWTIHLFFNTWILSSRISENQISSGILTIFNNWGLNYYVLDKSKFSKLISAVIWVVQLWRIPTLITKLTLCSCITKLFAFCPLCVWDMDESLPRLKYALSGPSSVYTKNKQQLIYELETTDRR